MGHPDPPELSVFSQIFQRSSRLLEEESADWFDPYRTYQYGGDVLPPVCLSRLIYERARSLPDMALDVSVLYV